MVWPRDNKLKRLQEEARAHNEEVMNEIKNSSKYKGRKLYVKEISKDDGLVLYTDGFGKMI